MFVSKKALAILALTAAGTQAYKVTPPRATKSGQSFLQKASVAGAAAFLVSSSAGVLSSDAANFDSAQQWDNSNLGRSEFNVNRDAQYNSINRQNTNNNFGNMDVMDRNMQRNNLMSSNNKFDRNTAPKVRSWPEAKYLAPVQELDNSLAMLKSKLSSNRDAEGIQDASNMMENFFQKSNNKKTFKGLASAYSSKIQFQNPSDGSVRRFERSFMNDADQTIRAMEEARGKLKTLANKRADKVTPDVLASINQAQNGLRNFLNKVPASDVGSARSLAQSGSYANSWFEGDEMNYLANNQKDVYSTLKSYV